MKIVEIGINYIISWMERQTPVWLLKGTLVYRPALSKRIRAELEFGDPSGKERLSLWKERWSPDRLLKPNWSSAVHLDWKGTLVSRPAPAAEPEFGAPSGWKGTLVYRPALEAELEFGDPS